MICESEMLKLQLHLYTRRVYPGIAYDPKALSEVLAEAEITAMRQLFNLGGPVRKDLADCVLARTHTPAAEPARARAA